MSNAKPVSRFPVPALSDMPDDIRERILAVQEKSGLIPNVFLALSHRPDEFRAFFAYHDALMEKPGNLTKAEREARAALQAELEREAEEERLAEEARERETAEARQRAEQERDAERARTQRPTRSYGMEM